MAEELQKEAARVVELAYESDNLSEDMALFNQQQFLTLQLLLQNKSLEKEAERSAQCTLAAKREADLSKQRESEAKAARLAERKKKVKIITVEERIDAMKKIDLDELLTELE